MEATGRDGSAASEAKSDGAPADEMATIARAIDEARVQSALERASLRRRLWWWRFGGVLMLLIVALAFIFRGANPRTMDHIARFHVTGVITDDAKRDRLLTKLAENDAVKAVIVRIDSPGGSTVGGEALYVGVRALAEKKPVVALMGQTAASAGYMTAIAADHIVARGNSLTASVGVLITIPNVHEAMTRLGVSMDTIRSGALKATPSAFDPKDPAAFAYTKTVVEESFEWFIGLVKERRKLSDAAIAKIADGRVMSGRMALAQGLVDAIGGEETAVAWLEKERGVKSDLPIYDHKITPSRSVIASVLDLFFGSSSTIRPAIEGPKLWSILQ
ncbi:MAG: signal peptide peptidase SppA [Neomegalonema sp.]|nr:signal peptide peptidase SppA [Neomegalonema sp.]